MKVNPNKFHPLLTTKEDNCVTIAGGKAKNSQSEKILGITIVNRLYFNEHVNKLCGKDKKKINICASLSSYMRIKKEK